MRTCLQAGADPLVLVEQIIEQLHGELVRVLTEGGAGEGTSEEDSSADSVDKMIGCLQILLSTASQLKSSAYPDVAVEVALVKLARLEAPPGAPARRARPILSAPGVVGPGAPDQC